MVIIDIYDRLKDDTTLYGLLSASSVDSKIYPLQAHVNAETPYILYDVQNDYKVDDYLNMIIIQFYCVSEYYTVAENLRNRIAALLNIGNAIRQAIPYGYVRFENSQIDSSFNYVEPETQLFNNIAVYNILYNDCYEFLLQENGAFILNENGYYIRAS